MKAAETPAVVGLAQRTIHRPVTLAGTGLHTGAPVQLSLLPGPPNEGIVFVRRDLAAAEPIRATLGSVTASRRGVTLGAGGATVATVEHLLSAAAGMRIDNLRVEVTGPELPALDGSAAGFVRVFQEAGTVDQRVAAGEIHLAALEVSEGRGRAVTSAGEEFRVSYTVALPAPLGEQRVSLRMTDYEEGIAPARTWGFAEEAAALEAAGLARGASLENVLVIGPAGYVNTPRFPDEPARHKILDLIGDLALLGARLRGAVEVIAGGHTLHLVLAREIARRWGGATSERLVR